MPTLLRLDSSANLDHSATKTLTARFTAAWRSGGADRHVIDRDLHADPLPHIRNAELHFPSAGRVGTPVAPEEDELQDRIVAELLGADAVVIGAPMYNYSMPSTLKTWIDRIHLPGITTGIAPLPLAGRPVVIVTASGNAYDQGTPTETWDHVVPPLQIVLGDALGMDVHVVAARLTLATRVPDLASSADRAAAEQRAAEDELDRLAAVL